MITTYRFVMTDATARSLRCLLRSGRVLRRLCAKPFRKGNGFALLSR
jgi:hypothetical protein